MGNKASFLFAEALVFWAWGGAVMSSGNTLQEALCWFDIQFSMLLPVTTLLV